MERTVSSSSFRQVFDVGKIRFSVTDRSHLLEHSAQSFTSMDTRPLHNVLVGREVNPSYPKKLRSKKLEIQLRFGVPNPNAKPITV